LFEGSDFNGSNFFSTTLQTLLRAALRGGGVIERVALQRVYREMSFRV